jgi:hypothetical protein
MAPIPLLRFDARLSDIPWRGNHSYPPSAGCYGRSSEVFPPTSTSEGERPCEPLRALREVQNHRNATLAGQQETCWDRRGGRASLSTISR